MKQSLINSKTEKNSFELIDNQDLAMIYDDSKSLHIKYYKLYIS